MMEKPLFIPLMAVYYDKFESGEKRAEFRPYGPRWNEKTCRVGRAVTLSRGYGKKNRLSCEVYVSHKCPPTPDFLKIYGPEKQCFAIHMTEPVKLTNLSKDQAGS